MKQARVCILVCVSPSLGWNVYLHKAAALFHQVFANSSRLLQPDSARTAVLQGPVCRNCKKDDIDDDSQRAKSDRGRARWPDRSAARMTPDVCGTIAHRESDEVMSNSVHVCVPECTCIRVCA